MDKYYWDMEKCTWGMGEELTPEEATRLEEAIDLANEMLDEYVAANGYDPCFDTDEISAFSAEMWERYCSSGTLKREDLAPWLT